MSGELTNETAVGADEGTICGRDGCAGEIVQGKVENCSCHISPPCFQCTETNWLECPTCGWQARNDDIEADYANPESSERPSLEPSPHKPDVLLRLRQIADTTHDAAIVVTMAYAMDAIEGLRASGETRLRLINEAKAERDEARARVAELLAACKAQHQAIDNLFAMLIERSAPGFYPSKSGQPWEAALAGNAAIAKAEGR